MPHVPNLAALRTVLPTGIATLTLLLGISGITEAAIHPVAPMDLAPTLAPTLHPEDAPHLEPDLGLPSTVRLDPNALSLSPPTPPSPQSRRLAQTPDPAAEADRWKDQGHAQFGQGQYAEARESWRQALDLYRQVGNRKQEGWMLGNIGAVSLLLEDYETAITYSQQRLIIAEEVEDNGGLKQGYYNLSQTYQTLGDVSQAVSYQQRYADLLQFLGESEAEFPARITLGDLYFHLGDPQNTLTNFERALGVAQQLENRQSESQALVHLGIFYEQSGLHRQGIAYYEQALAIAQAMGYQEVEVSTLGNLGIAYKNLGFYVEALDYAQQQLILAQQLNDIYTQSDALSTLGSVYYQLGDYPQSAEYYAQVLTLVQGFGDPYRITLALNNLGITYMAQIRYDEAIPLLEESLALAKQYQNLRGQSLALGNLGVIATSRGEFDQAIAYHEQDLVIARQRQDLRSEAQSLNNLALAYGSLREHQRAIEYHLQSIAITRQIQDLDGEGMGLNNLGLNYFDLGDYAKAETALRDAIAVWEALRDRLGNNDAGQVSIFETQAVTYRMLQQTLVAQGKPEDALEVAERGRTRAFVERLLERVTKTNPDFTLSEAGYQALRESPNIERIQAIAKAHNATLVEYSLIRNTYAGLGESRPAEVALYIWVVKPTGEIEFREADLSELKQQDLQMADLVLQARDALGVRGIAVAARPRNDLRNLINLSVEKRLAMLHRVLIEPIADLLPSDPNDRVIIIPQDSLFLVPFAALQAEDGTYLIQRHTLLTAPSIQVLDLTTQQRQALSANAADAPALVVGNPVMPSVSPEFGAAPQPLPPLPGAEREARAIAALLGTQPLLGAAATETQVKQALPQAGRIHLATHGLLDEVEGLGSAIALTPSATDNGLLTADEILTLSLQADLVVLSACNTGRGEITGDGVAGLSRALITAGAPSVLVSLWQVPDDPTAQLMTHFYQNLQQGQDKAQALRQAMLTTLDQYPDPLDWAAFTLIGEAE